jgi:methyl-accepting chemotaxis protein
MKVLYKFKIWQRLYFVFLLIIIITVANLLFNLKGMDSSRQSVENINNSLRSITCLLEADRDAYKSSIAISQALNIDSSSGDQIQILVKEIKNNKEEVMKRYQNFTETFDVSKKEEFKVLDKNFREDYAFLSEMTDTIVRKINKGDFGSAWHLYYNDYNKYFYPTRESLTQLSAIHQEESALAFKDIIAIQNELKTTQLLLFAAVISIFILSGIILTRSISAPLDHSLEVTDEVAKGNLAVNIGLTGNDETGTVLKSLKSMTDQFRKMILSIKNITENLLSGSRKLSDASINLSQGTSIQASACREIASSMEEISVSISGNNDKVRRTKVITLNTAETIEKASISVDETIQSIKIILQKISVINEISFKTNMLAINASIEAARAGTYGKGFAVVAGEVKKLADNSREAAAEINEISVKTTQMANYSGELLKKILPEVKTNAVFIEEISRSTEIQNTNISQIAKAVDDLSKIVQQNSALSDELSASAEELNIQTENLMTSVALFRLE